MTLPPLRREVLVSCAPATAYTLFVDDIGSWWPVASFGCFGEGSTVSFDGERFVETGPDGQTAVWGTITEAAPPRRVAFTWHPGLDPAAATHVAVTFTSTGDPDVALVTLEHTGWEAYAEPAAARDNYAGGWVTVLGRLVAALPAVPSGAASPNELWFVLQHTAGPEAPRGGVFASPDFPKHLEFLRSLRADGSLVAGGPLPDAPGAGMTVVRAVDLDQAQRIIAAARTADGAVTSGLLDVRVRPWRVVLTGQS